MAQTYSSGDAVDLDAHPNARKLVNRCKDLFSEVHNMTPGYKTEAFLNEHYGPGNPIYEDLCRLIRNGIRNNEGWCATIPIDGPKYRRSKIALPSEETRYLSITTVYMDSQEPYSGQYHQHRMCIPHLPLVLGETSQANAE